MTSASLNHDPFPGWEGYPSKDTLDSTLKKDMTFYQSFLVQNQSRLFESDSFEFEILRSLYDNDRSNHASVKIEAITNIHSLVEQLRGQNNKGGQLFYIIPQLFSWGQLQISREAFQQILVCQHVFPPFLHVVNEFGSKIRHEFPKCNTSYTCSYVHTHSTSETEVASGPRHDYELSYILQFMERNGRNRGDPWSLRQTGVYQQATYSNCQSTWIFLQLSRSARVGLEKVLRSQSSRTSGNESPMTLHALLFGATIDNWAEYIQDLSTQLSDLDEKACLSKIGAVSAYGYSITFSDMQTLQKLRHKILKTSLVLSACLGVATKMIEHCHTLDKFGFTPPNEKVEKSINAYVADIEVHQQSVRLIMETLQGTFDMLSKIIEFRNIESLRSISEASEKHMAFLNGLTLQIRNENCASATLAVHTHKDAKAMKALTTVATIFLPASVIATIFSSSLVQVRQNGDSDGQSTHLVVATQFWIYVVITLALTIITVGSTRLLEHQWLSDSS